MKILFVTFHGWNYGGAETYMYAAKRELERRGNEVKVFSSDFGKIDHDIKSDYIFECSKTRAGNLAKMVFNFNSLFALKRALEDFKPDIVHVNSLSTEMSPSIFFALRHIKTVMTIHSTNTFYPVEGLRGLNKVYEPIRTAIRRHMIHNVDLFTCPSEAVKKHIPKRIQPLEVLYVAIEEPKWSEITNYRNLIFVGRIAKDKGPDVLIKALPMILEKIPGVSLKIVGDGPLLDECKRLVAKLKLENVVEFVGYLAKDKVEGQIRNSTIAFMPSVYDEPLGLSGIESLFIGRPVVASNVGGIPEWLNDAVGSLVAPNDEDAIAHAAISLLEDKEGLQKRSIGGPTSVRKFAIKSHVDRLSTIYDSLV